MTNATEKAEYDAMDGFGQVEYNQAIGLGLSHREAMIQAGYGDDPVPMVLTLADIDRGYDNPEWLGFGYLGERRHAEASIRTVATADKAVIRFANEEGWDEDQLFEWLNSKPGRWFGDLAFGNYPPGGGRWSITKLVAEGRRQRILYDVLAEAAANGWV